jgi:hypothetical protein
MELLKSVKAMGVLKIVGMALGALVLFVVAVSLIGSITRTLDLSRLRGSVSSVSPGQGFGYGEADSYKSSGDIGSVGLSMRNVIAPPGEPQPSVGNNAEDFEVTNYSGTIETRELDKTCSEIQQWKESSYVIFENASKFKHGCAYSFKVEKAHADELVEKIQALHPKELTLNTHTIKRLVDDYTSEEDILKKKKASIEQTLEDALRGYADITSLATRTANAETLASVIESKLRTLERLTQERISVNEQLDRLGRSKAEQLDRLAYTVFVLNVQENKYVDGEALKDSWKFAVREFVQEMNTVAQDVSIRLLTLLAISLQYALYFFLALVFVKYGWKWAKAIWRK